MNEMEKLAALFDRVAALDDDTDGRSVDMAVGLKLAQLIKNGEKVLAAVSGDSLANGEGGFDMQLKIAILDGCHYFMIFPDRETADKLGLLCTECSIGELLRLAYKTPQMHGLQLIYGVDGEKRSVGIINRYMVEIAVKTAEK